MDYSQDPPTYQYYLFTTQDGGSTWISSPYPGEALYFFSTDTGWAFSDKIHRTIDGGLSWTVVSNVSWTVVSDVTWSAQVDFVSEQIGWGVAQAEAEMALVKSIDGGAKWAMLVPSVGPQIGSLQGRRVSRLFVWNFIPVFDYVRHIWTNLYFQEGLSVVMNGVDDEKRKNQIRNNRSHR
jgi:hypothetical protein